jgi:hypothetical protein
VKKVATKQKGNKSTTKINKLPAKKSEKQTEIQSNRGER